MPKVPLLTKKTPGLPDSDCVSPRCRGPELCLEHNAAGRTNTRHFHRHFSPAVLLPIREADRARDRAGQPEAAGAESRLPGDHPDLRRPGMTDDVAAFGARLGDRRRRVLRDPVLPTSPPPPATASAPSTPSPAPSRPAPGTPEPDNPVRHESVGQPEPESLVQGTGLPDYP